MEDGCKSWGCQAEQEQQWESASWGMSSYQRGPGLISPPSWADQPLAGQMTQISPFLCRRQWGLRCWCHRTLGILEESRNCSLAQTTSLTNEAGEGHSGASYEAPDPVRRDPAALHWSRRWTLTRQLPLKFAELKG